MTGDNISLAEQIVFINMTPEIVFSLIGIGFVGGLLSGFLGTGGAFIMTPAMMSLGIPGIMAVAANVTHKFGKAIIGSKKHSEFGNVDKKMGLIMFIALFAGVKSAVTLNKIILDETGTAGSNLYISLIFIIVLAGVSIFMFRDIMGRRKGNSLQDTTPDSVAHRIRKLNMPPMIHFKVANVRTSLWLVLLVGLATGFLAGTIGVGGFIGIPAMIYLLGVPIRVAAGTELFLAIFSGMQGAFLYALNGFVDLRIPLLLYLGSIVGVTLGAVGTQVVNTSQIKLVMASIITIVVLSRASMVPGYLAQMGYLNLEPGILDAFDIVSNLLLWGSGAVGCGLILWWMLKALTGNIHLMSGSDKSKIQ